MKKSNILLYTLVLGSCAALVAKAAVRKPKEKKASSAIDESRRKEVEGDILKQLVELVKTRQQIETAEGKNTETLKQAINRLPLEAKEEVFVLLVDQMLAEKERPFKAPQDYTQMDAFFHLITLLMEHDPELVEKITPCIGERNPLTLHQQLKSCLVKTPQPVQKKLSTQELDWKEKAKLLLKIKQRMAEKGAAPAA